MNKGKYLPTRIILGTLLAAVLTVAPAPAAPTTGEDGVVFTLRAPDANEVFLAGDFNGWNATAQPLNRGDDGVWSTTIALDAGQYEYKFVVDGQWREDPGNPEKKTDPFGGSNSLLKVGADGAVVSPTARATQAAPAGGEKTAVAGKPAGDVELGRPRAVDGGVLFTWGDPGSGSVFLAGNFNEWNATSLPLTLGENGVWSTVVELPTGKHEYKFVVDGAWFADPENPETEADPYGGANSLVTIDDAGDLVASAEIEPQEDAFRANTTLNARVNMNGRYLTRFEIARGLYDDPRYRMQRPLQTVDLNFLTEVSDVTETLFRMRLDSGENIIQNNIAAFLDEAYLQVRPETFFLKAYWNQEIFTGEDPMRMGGDIDLPGTIGPDHVDFGKGSAGFLFEAEPLGNRFRAFFANMYNQDYYNDPDLFDNTGEDRVGVRLSRDMGRFTVGLPAYMERSLMAYDLSALTGAIPTGIPALDEHLLATGDGSVYYTAEDHRYNAGLDLSVRLRDDLTVRGQGMAIDEFQGLIWGDQSGLGNSGAAIDVPFYERERVRFRTQVDWQPRPTMDLMAQHTWGRTWGAQEDHRDLVWSFAPQAEANNRIYMTIEPAGPEVDLRWTELEFDWHRGNRDLKVWLWRLDRDLDYGAVGATVTTDRGEELEMANETVWYASAIFGGGDPSGAAGRAEFEFGAHWTDSDLGRSADDSYEMILRYDLDLTRRIGFISDVRYINFPRGPEGDGAFLVSKNQYFSPFVGFRYRPIRPMELVLAYGVDPVDFSIDYDGRQVGRWWYRQNYLFDHPGASKQEAEAFLADARVITLRAQVRF